MQTDNVLIRQAAFNEAGKLLDPLVEKHGLEAYRTSSGLAAGTTVTAVDQHLDHIIRIADWLMETS